MFRATLLIALLALVPSLIGDRAACRGIAPRDPASVRNVRRPSDRYFVVVFSYQDADNHVLKSHTFATFAKASNFDLRSKTTGRRASKPVRISWLPAKFADTLRLSFFPTAGKNFTLGETLKFAEQLDVQVRHGARWRSTPTCTDKAVRRSEQLASGDVRYQVYDSSKPRTKAGGERRTLHRRRRRTGRHAYVGTVRGFAAGEQIVEHFRPHVKQTETRRGCTTP